MEVGGVGDQEKVKWRGCGVRVCKCVRALWGGWVVGGGVAIVLLER